MKRRFFLTCSFILAFALIILLLFFRHGQFLRKKTAHPSFPNVLFIVLDAARADHFSCYGYKRDTTPHIDAIAKEGTIFLNNVSQGTVTVHSLSAMFFSRYFSMPVFQTDAWRWGIKFENPHSIFKKFDDQQINLTKLLSLSGYRTILFTDSVILNERDYFAHEFDERVYVPKDSILTKGSIPSLNSLIEKNKKKRFFIYCHIKSPHTPYLPKAEDNEFVTGIEAADVERVIEKTIKWQEKKEQDTAEWSPDELSILQGLYDSKLKRADKIIGLIYDKLKELYLDDKTLVIITSDHGENLGEHGAFEHGGLAWDSLIKTPLIIIYPALFPPGTKVKGLTESIDIMPTIVDACGLKIPAGKSMDGISLIDFVRNPDSGKEAVFTKQSIRTDRFKYMSETDALYDIKDDPDEKINIAQGEPRIKEELRDRLIRSMEQYVKRYEAAKKTNPPDYPFYFGMHVLEITPGDALEEYNGYGEDITDFWGKTSLKKPYLFNRNTSGYGLFFMPRARSNPPLSFSTSLPNGTYHAFILLESLSNAYTEPGQLGFQFRFSQRKPFSLPRKVDLIMKESKSSYCYLDLGKVKVNSEKFFVEVKFQPPDDKVYIIRHIKFIPEGCQNDKQSDELNEEEFRRRKENLKSLGYL